LIRAFEEPFHTLMIQEAAVGADKLQSVVLDGIMRGGQYQGTGQVLQGHDVLGGRGRGQIRKDDRMPGLTQGAGSDLHQPFAVGAAIEGNQNRTRFQQLGKGTRVAADRSLVEVLVDNPANTSN
jgi:hypothetical protein